MCENISIVIKKFDGMKRLCTPTPLGIFAFMLFLILLAFNVCWCGVCICKISWKMQIMLNEWGLLNIY